MITVNLYSLYLLLIKQKLDHRERQMKTRLKETDRKLLNEQLRELQEIREDLLAADGAKVPGIKEMIEGCDNCIERVKLLKKTYFPNKD